MNIRRQFPFLGKIWIEDFHDFIFHFNNRVEKRTNNTCIGLDMYFNNFGLNFGQIGEKGPFVSVIIRGFAVKKNGLTIIVSYRRKE